MRTRMGRRWKGSEERLLAQVVCEVMVTERTKAGGGRLTIPHHAWLTVVEKLRIEGYGDRTVQSCRHKYYDELVAEGAVARGAWLNEPYQPRLVPARAPAVAPAKMVEPVVSCVVLPGLYLAADLNRLSPDCEYKIVIYTTTIDGDALFRVTRIEGVDDSLGLLLRGQG